MKELSFSLLSRIRCRGSVPKDIAGVMSLPVCDLIKGVSLSLRVLALVTIESKGKIPAEIRSRRLSELRAGAEAKIKTDDKKRTAAAALRAM